MLLPTSTAFTLFNVVVEAITDNGLSENVHVAVTEGDAKRILIVNLGVGDTYLRKQVTESIGKRCTIHGAFVSEAPTRLYLVMTSLYLTPDAAEPATPSTL